MTAHRARLVTPVRLRLLAAAAALATAWLATPHAVPLFDGIGVPDEPYRYVDPPAGYQKTPAPSSFTMTVPAKNGVYEGSGFYAQTSEQSSQFGVFISPGSITGPATTKTLTVSLTPKAPDGSTPSGPINGNIYQVSFLTDDGATATITPAAADTLVLLMRATSPKIATAAVLYRPAGGSWSVVPDQKGGTDSFQAYLQGPGEYALVAGSGAATGGSSHTLVIVILVFVVLAMAGAVVLIRLSRRAAPGP